MARPNKQRPSFSRHTFVYERCEPRTMLTTLVDVGNLNSGVAVSEDATGEGFIMYSDADVHERFSGIVAENADHFVATRLDGLQWQYNNDQSWIDFEPVDSDALVAQLSFDGDSVQNENFTQPWLEGIWFRHEFSTVDSTPIDFQIVANQFGGSFDQNEFTVLGSTFEIEEAAPEQNSEAQLSRIADAMERQDFTNRQVHGLASFDVDGNPLLSWRVHLLPHMGLENLYQQFNLDEPWNSENNLPLADQMPEIFKSPNFDSDKRTSFLAVAGDKTPFQLDGTPLDRDEAGVNSAAILVEVNQSRSAVWTSPVDWYYNEGNPLSGLGQASDEGFAVVTLGGISTTVSPDVDAAGFANLVDSTDDSALDFEALGFKLSPEESRRSIALALLNHESRFRRFPLQAIQAEDGTPLLSWRVAILRDLGYQELYDQFNLDEAWDSANNLPLVLQIPEAFRNASTPEGTTVFLGLDGQGTLFNSSLIQGVSVNNVIDGASNTILFVEADASEAIEWSRPVDLAFDAADPVRGLGALNGDGRFNAALVNAYSASFATDQPDKIPAWATISNREVNDYAVVTETDRTRGNEQTEQKLKQITLAMLNYESAHMRLPHTIYDTPSGEGTPLLGWRVRILPYLEQNALYEQFHLNEPWDSPHNLSLIPLMPPLFSSPGVANGMTVFQGAHGANTVFSNTNRGKSISSFNTQDVAAVLELNTGSAIEWTRPDDFAFDAATMRSLVENANATGFHFSLLDSSVYNFNDTIGSDVLIKLVSPGDYEHVNLDMKVFRDAYGSFYSSFGSTQTQIRQIALAAHNFESAMARLPHHATYGRPEGDVPLLSWRVDLLPYIGYGELHQKFNHNEPWDSPHNLALLPLMPHTFGTPGVENGMTVFQAISSEYAPGETVESLFPRSSEYDFNFENILDGSSNTVLFVETNPDQAIEWTKPEDINYDVSDPAAGLAMGENLQGTWIALGDASARFVPSNLLTEQWAAAISPHAGDYPNFYSDEGYQYGTIVPNVNLGTEENDSVIITVSGDSVEITVNGESQTWPLTDFDPLIFDGLVGVDELTINGPAGVDITFADGAISVGDFSIVAEGFESVELGNDVALRLNGTDGDDQVELLFDGNTVSGMINGNDLGLPAFPASQKLIVDAGLGNDSLEIFTNDQDNQSELDLNSLTMFGDVDLSWESVEFVSVETTNNINTNFIVYSETVNDAFTVSPNQIVLKGDDTTLTLAREPNNSTGLGNREGLPTPIAVEGTSEDDIFEFNYNTNDLPFFLFHHYVLLIDSPVTFDGGDGNDQIIINRNETFSRPLIQAELSPNSAAIDDYGLISWTNVEQQVAGDIGIVTLHDSDGDDTLRIQDDSIRLTGDNYAWTLFDIDRTDAYATAGIDNAIISGDARSLDLRLEQSSVEYGGDELVVRGFENVFATASDADDRTKFYFGEEVLVDLLVSDEELQFTSPTTDATVTISAFGQVTLSGDGSNTARFTTNSTSNDETTASLGQVIFDGVGNDSVKFFMTGIARVEMFAGTNIGPLRMQGMLDDDSLTLFEDALDLSLQNGSIFAEGYLETVVYGFAGNNTASTSGDFDSLEMLPDGRLNLANENMSVELREFQSIDFSSVASLPVFEGGDFADDNFLIDYSDGPATLTANDFPTQFVVGNIPVSLDGNGGEDTVTLVTSAGETVRLTEQQFVTGVSRVNFEDIEYVNIDGQDDETPFTIASSISYANEIAVNDTSVSWSNDSLSPQISVTGFPNFVVAPEESPDNFSFIDNRTSSGDIVANENSVDFVGGSTFDVIELDYYEMYDGVAIGVLTLVDSSRDDVLTIRNESTELSGEDYSIIAFGFSDVLATATSGYDTVGIEAMISEILIETDGFLIGDVRVKGFESIELFDDITTPVVRGTSADDNFRISYLSGMFSFEANDLETVIITNDLSDFNLDGNSGNDLLSIIAPELDTVRLETDRFVTSGSSTFWSNVESIDVRGNNELSDILIKGSDGDDTFTFDGESGSTSISSDGGPTLTIGRFTTTNVQSGGGSDVAYLSGSDNGSNIFIGAAIYGRLTTPDRFVTVRGFDLVSAVSKSDNDLASFVGTEAKEDFFAGPDSARLVGGSFVRNTSGFAKVIARSGGGQDFANITDSEGDDLFFARRGYARVGMSNDRAITLTDFATVRSVSGSGDDRAQFVGSDDAERFLASDRFGRLNGIGFGMIAVSYPLVTADGGGGFDQAFLSDSDGDDFFFGSPEMSFLNGEGFQNNASNFESVAATASEGRDTAELNGSALNETFYGNPSLANLSGDGFFQFGSGFDFVRAFGRGGNDSATLRDSDATDHFFANAEFSYLRNNNFHNEVRNFNQVKAISVSGDDIAAFEGTSGNDLFHGHRDSSYIEGAGFRYQVNGFSQVSAVGLAGADVANLYDSDEDERFGGRDNSAWLEGDTYRLQITDFDLVNAYAFQGGTNSFFVDDPDFEWNRFGNWQAL